VELDKALMQDDTQSVFDHITSIDSAYHYNTRQAFFQQSRNHLKPNGTLALYDLVVHDDVNLTTPRSRLFLKVMCWYLRLPLGNLVNQNTYRAYLEQAGYHHIEFDSLPPNQVFGGLSRHCLRQRKEMKTWRLGNWQDMLYLTISSTIFGQLASHRWLQPTIVKAQAAAGGD
jgi:SAM-dependent methyltransferase